jgi:hypothetical protein
MASFKIELDMGNDAMQTAEDVAGVLIRIAAQLTAEGFYTNSAQWVRDANGNRVGTFKYENRDRSSLHGGR